MTDQQPRPPTLDFGVCTFDQLMAYNIAWVEATRSTAEIAVADERIRSAIRTFAWSECTASKPPCLYVDVCEVRRPTDLLVGIPSHELSQPLVDARFLCGVPAYIETALRRRGFYTCLAWSQRKLVLRVSLVKLTVPPHPPTT